MKKTVIIGAGTVGLYLAYKLRKAGITNVAVYDHRAGEYTRPGHLTDNVFRLIERNTGFKSIKIGESYHIKDAERLLFAEISKLKLTIEKKRFIRLNNPDEPKGVFVSDHTNKEFFVEADYVFDCSGTVRCVVKNMNEQLNQPAFEVKQISTQAVIRRYLIAYVGISEIEANKIDLMRTKYQDLNFPLTAEKSAQLTGYLLRLNELGWEHFVAPQVYTAQFGKDNNKSCLYLECPDNLDSTQNLAWIRAAINAVTVSDGIVFNELPKEKYTHKKPIQSFLVNPIALQQVSFEHNNFPTIIPMGDALIEPHFELGHGITHAIKIVNDFISGIEVLNGHIAFYDSEIHLASVSKKLKSHQNDIKDYYVRRSEYFSDRLKQSEEIFSDTISVASSKEERDQLILTLQIIRARRVYKTILKQLNEYLQARLALDNKVECEANLIKLYCDIMPAVTILPSSAIKLREDLLALIPMIASVWKKMGVEQLKANNLTDALYYFQQAVAVQQYILLTDAIKVEKLVLYSNIIITFKKLDRTPDIIKLSEEVLALFPDSPILTAIETKILFNLIKAYAVVIPTVARNLAVQLSVRMRDLYQTYQNTFDDQMKRVLAKDVMLFDSYMSVTAAKPSTAGLFSLAAGMDIFQANLQAAIPPETKTTELTMS